MYDHTLASVNQRYKSGTHYVEDWLMKSVRQRCNLLGIECSLDAIPSGTPSVDLMQLAQELHSGCRPSLPPPQDIESAISTIRNVIAGRREAAKWHQQSPKDQKAQHEDYSHRRFREVLTAVLGTLQQVQQASMSTVKQARLPKSRRSTGSSSEDSSSGPSVTEPGASDSPGGPRKIPSGMRPQSKKSTKRQDERSLWINSYDPDVQFALVCFLEECWNVRETLKQMWRSVKRDDKAISYTVASLVTNSGIAMITNSATQFITEYPRFAAFDNVTRAMKPWYARSSKSDSSRSRSDSGRHDSLGGSSRVSECEKSELVCMPAMGLLTRIRRLLQGKEHDALLQIMAGHALGADIVTSLPELSKLRNDASRRREAFAGCDVFTQLIMSYSMDSQLIPLATVMALQVWMDVHDSLGRDFEARRSEEFESLVQLVFNTRDAHLIHDEQAISPKHTSLIGEQQTSNLRSRLVGIVEQGLETPLFVANTVPLPAHLSKASAPRVLATLPGLSGHISSTVCGMVHTEGVHICNQGLLVHSIAHLYRAAQKLSPHFFWDDLEFLIFHQRLDTFGLQGNGEPTSAANLFRRSLGVNPHDQKTGARQPLPSFEVCYAKAKKLHGSLAYCSQYGQNKEDLSKPDQLASSCQQYAECATSNGRAVTTTQALGLLRGGLNADEVFFHFDHRAFFEDCLDIMDHVMQSLSKPTLSRLPENYMFYQVVDELLWEKKACLLACIPPESFLKVTAVLIEHSSHAKHFSAAEGTAGRPDENYRQSRPGAVQARAKEEEAKAEKAEKEQAHATKVRAEEKQQQRAHEKKARVAGRAGQYYCLGCGRCS